MGECKYMNLMHLKYVVEIDKTRSISKAAENLYMGQPNLSRSIKELEQSLQITIFKRTPKGIEVTPDGEEFIQYAKKILADVETVEKKYTQKEKHKEKFSILGPRASYIGYSFVEFMRGFDSKSLIEIVYKETNSLKAINKVLQGEYRLGIIRYRSSFQDQFKKMFEEKGLDYELIYEFRHRLIVHQSSPLCKIENITYHDLENYIEICYPDPYVPHLPFSDVKKIELPDSINRRIYIYERASQFDLLENLDNTFMWVSPVPKELLDKYNLVEIKCNDNVNEYRDVLIFRKGYHLTDIDKRFLTILCDIKREVNQD